MQPPTTIHLAATVILLFVSTAWSSHQGPPISAPVLVEDATRHERILRIAQQPLIMYETSVADDDVSLTSALPSPVRPTMMASPARVEEENHRQLKKSATKKTMHSPPIKAVFEVDLEKLPIEVRDVPHFSMVPKVLTRCLRSVASHGAGLPEGIYRISGNKENVMKLVERLEENPLDPIFPNDDDSVHTVSSTCKYYVRTRPISIIPEAYHKSLISAVVGDPSDKVMDQNIVGALLNMRRSYPYSFAALIHILSHLRYEILPYEPITKMTVVNLGIVWGPNLIFTKNALDPNAMTMLQAGTKLVERALLSSYIEEHLGLYRIEDGRPISPFVPSGPAAIEANEHSPARQENYDAPSPLIVGSTSPSRERFRRKNTDVTQFTRPTVAERLRLPAFPQVKSEMDTTQPFSYVPNGPLAGGGLKESVAFTVAPSHLGPPPEVPQRPRAETAPIKSAVPQIRPRPAVPVENVQERSNRPPRAVVPEASDVGVVDGSQTNTIPFGLPSRVKPAKPSMDSRPNVSTLQSSHPAYSTTSYTRVEKARSPPDTLLSHLTQTYVDKPRHSPTTDSMFVPSIALSKPSMGNQRPQPPHLASFIYATTSALPHQPQSPVSTSSEAPMMVIPPPQIASSVPIRVPRQPMSVDEIPSLLRSETHGILLSRPRLDKGKPGFSITVKSPVTPSTLPSAPSDVDSFHLSLDSEETSAHTPPFQPAPSIPAVGSRLKTSSGDAILPPIPPPKPAHLKSQGSSPPHLAIESTQPTVIDAEIRHAPTRPTVPARPAGTFVPPYNRLNTAPLAHFPLIPPPQRPIVPVGPVGVMQDGTTTSNTITTEPTVSTGFGRPQPPPRPQPAHGTQVGASQGGQPFPPPRTRARAQTVITKTQHPGDI